MICATKERVTILLKLYIILRGFEKFFHRKYFYLYFPFFIFDKIYRLHHFLGEIIICKA